MSQSQTLIDTLHHLTLSQTFKDLMLRVHTTTPTQGKGCGPIAGPKVMNLRLKYLY